MAAAQKLKMQVEISYEDLLGLIQKLDTGQKILLFEDLRMQAFAENWFRLAGEIPQAGFSEDEILAEIKETRRARHANAQ